MGGSNERSDVDVLSDYLRLVGLPDANTIYLTTEMIHYFRGRLGL